MWYGPVRIRKGDWGAKVLIYTPFEFDTTEIVDVVIETPSGEVLYPNVEVEYEDDYTLSFHLPDVFDTIGVYKVWCVIHSDGKRITTPKYEVKVY